MKENLFGLVFLVFCVILTLNLYSQPAEKVAKEKQLNLPEGVSSDW